MQVLAFPQVRIHDVHASVVSVMYVYIYILPKQKQPGCKQAARSIRSKVIAKWPKTSDIKEGQEDKTLYS